MARVDDDGPMASAYDAGRGLLPETVAVEPAAAMRGQIGSKHPADRVWPLGGNAERLPLRDASCSPAWLSNGAPVRESIWLAVFRSFAALRGTRPSTARS